MTERALLRLSGALLVGGFLLFYVVTQALHPSGQENNHPIIFTKYAESESWIWVHFVQFAGVLTALGGFVVLYRLSIAGAPCPRRRAPPGAVGAARQHEQVGRRVTAAAGHANFVLGEREEQLESAEGRRRQSGRHGWREGVGGLP